MKLVDRISLRDFDAWCEAKDHLAQLTDKEIDQLETIIEDMYPDGISSVKLNDLLRFDFEDVCDWLGLEYDADHDEIIRDDD